MHSEIKQLYVSLDDKLLEKLQQSFRLWAVVVCVSLRCVCVSVRCAVCCRKHFHSFNQQSDSRQMMQQLLTSNHIYIYTNTQSAYVWFSPALTHEPRYTHSAVIICVVRRSAADGERQLLSFYSSDSKSAAISRLSSDIVPASVRTISGHVFPGVSVFVLTPQSLVSQNQEGWKWVIPSVWPGILSSTSEINILPLTRRRVNSRCFGPVRLWRLLHTTEQSRETREASLLLQPRQL